MPPKMPLDPDALLAEVRANLAVLDACGDHDFDIPAPFTLRARAVCRRCGGKTDPAYARWYERGREHERASVPRDPLRP